MSQTRAITSTKSAPSLRLIPEAPKETPNLSKQYGGVHSGGWVDLLPKSWVPYIQLSRLSPPVGFILIYLPHLFGIIHAASMRGSSLSEVFHIASVLFVGSFFCNNGSHAWNDLADAPIDAKVERTKTRPIPRGAISRKAAFVFACSQAALSAACLRLLPSETAWATIPTIIGTLYYPFAKRHTNFPQVVLGFCMTWGVMIGSSAMGVDAPWKNGSVICLLAAATLWVILFDTVYAHQDLADDLKVGVKSIAVFCNGFAKPLLFLLYVGMIYLLWISGVYGNMRQLYYLITVWGCAVSVGAMVALVDLKNPSSCWRWFSNGFWSTGLSIVAGLLANYAMA